MHTVRAGDAAIWQGSHGGGRGLSCAPIRRGLQVRMPRAAEGRRCACPGQAGAAAGEIPRLRRLRASARNDIAREALPNAWVFPLSDGRNQHNAAKVFVDMEV